MCLVYPKGNLWKSENSNKIIKHFNNDSIFITKTLHKQWKKSDGLCHNLSYCVVPWKIISCFWEARQTRPQISFHSNEASKRCSFRYVPFYLEMVSNLMCPYFVNYVIVWIFDTMVIVSDCLCLPIYNFLAYDEISMSTRHKFFYLIGHLRPILVFCNK